MVPGQAKLVCPSGGTEAPGQALITRLIQRTKVLARHLFLIILVIALTWAGIGFTLWHERKEVEREAATDTANLSRTFDEDITRTIEAIDQTLLFVREAYQHDPEGVLRGSWTKGHAFRDDLQVQLGLADRNGEVLWSNLGPVSPEINLADRAYFLAQQTSRDDNLFIGKPVISRVSGKQTIQFVRKLLAADGSFNGIAVVSLNPAYLSRFYGSISIGKGSILLATTDGTILARAPNGMPLIGTELPADTKARMLLGNTSGAFRAVSGIDQVDRIVSSRRLERYPLVLAVSLSSEDVFAAYRRNQQLYLAVGVLLSLACIIVGVVMLRQRQSLLDSRQALSATLENMSQGITMVRADGSIPVLNRRAIDLLELPAELLARRPTFQQIVDWQRGNREFGVPENRDMALARVLEKKNPPLGDYCYERTRPNGMVLEVRTQGLLDGGMVRTFTDITERRRNEAALVAAQARATHAERMQALGQLAGGIAHDFNNILQAVQGAATLIDKRAADPGSVQRFARMILESTQRGSSITRRLLAFARRGELRAEAIDPGELLSGLRDVLGHALGSSIMVDVKLAADVPPLLADTGQLETVLVNLATNARDAMPDGGLLTFATAVDTVQANANHPAELRPGRYVRLSIADTGTGIDPGLLARVLEPFFTTKLPGQGTGLGLSMAKGFAEQSGGGLTIESRPGRGTTVYLWLPAAIRCDVTSRVPAAAAAVRDDTGKRILLVDDEAMVRETLAASLEEGGYIVLVAEDAAGALELLRSPVEVDVLVTDLSMPGIDGLKLIRQAQLQRSGLPALLLTGYAGHGAQLAVGGSVSGAFSLVRKPVTAAQLADRIEALLAVTLA
jgi:signal transduction histidine kinase/ActR/RegA family two-component response regulator